MRVGASGASLKCEDHQESTEEMGISRVDTNEESLPRERCSQGGPASGVPLSCCPVSPTSRFSSQEFRVLCFVASGFSSLFLCTLAGMAVLSTPLATTTQRVLQLGCWVAGDSHLKAQQLAVGKQLCVNVFVRDLDIAILGVMDNRRPEVVADVLPLFHGVQLAVDTTPPWWSPEKGPFSMPSKCHCGRRRLGEGEAEEGSDVSRIGRTIWPLPLLCWLVKWEEGGQRSARISVGHGKSSRPPQSHEESRSTGMVVALELPLCLQRSESVRIFLPRMTGGVGV